MRDVLHFEKVIIHQKKQIVKGIAIYEDKEKIEEHFVRINKDDFKKLLKFKRYRIKTLLRKGSKK